MQNYAFSMKLPRKKKEFCKSSAKSPEICKIPNRTGQNLRHLRIDNRRPKGKPNLRDPTLNDRIGRKALIYIKRFPLLHDSPSFCHIFALRK